MNEYLSVTEYATRVERSVSGIRQLLAVGKLPGKKIGNQWVIPADAELPTDGRVKSGKYRNRRKK
jgi:hypothetical protein